MISFSRVFLKTRGVSHCEEISWLRTQEALTGYSGDFFAVKDSEPREEFPPAQKYDQAATAGLMHTKTSKIMHR